MSDILFVDYVHDKIQPLSQEIVEATEKWHDWHIPLNHGPLLGYYISKNNPTNLFAIYQDRTTKYIGLIIWNERDSLPDWIYPSQEDLLLHFPPAPAPQSAQDKYIDSLKPH